MRLTRSAEDPANRPTLATTVGCEFWDRHHHISEDHDFWMAHPLCRQAINRRVSGDGRVYPFDHLYRAAGSPRFERALSLGCGTGRVERAMVQLGIATEVDALDGSRVSIGIAREAASAAGLSNIHYEVADLNRVRLPRRQYDAVVFHQSLHHVASVEKLLERVLASLKSTGLLFLEEWTGPSRFEWTEANLRRARGRFEALPASWRQWPELRAPIEEADPSEAIRSSAILPAVERLFEVELARAYGGQYVSLLLPQVDRAAMSSSELDGLVAGWLELEDAELARDPKSSFYTAILARPRRGVRRWAGRIASFVSRVPLVLRHRVLAPMGRRKAGAREP